jgi:hypothetical protein
MKTFKSKTFVGCCQQILSWSPKLAKGYLTGWSCTLEGENYECLMTIQGPELAWQEGVRDFKTTQILAVSSDYPKLQPRIGRCRTLLDCKWRIGRQVFVWGERPA